MTELGTQGTVAPLFDARTRITIQFLLLLQLVQRSKLRKTSARVISVLNALT